MSSTKYNLLQINWPLWDRVFGVLTKTGADFYKTKKEDRSVAEIYALNHIHRVLDRHYALVHTTNCALNINNNGSLKPLIKGQDKVPPRLIVNLMIAFKSAQLALAPVRPLVAKEIEVAFADDQGATGSLTPVKTQEPVSRPRCGCHKVAALTL